MNSASQMLGSNPWKDLLLISVKSEPLVLYIQTEIPMTRIVIRPVLTNKYCRINSALVFTMPMNRAVNTQPKKRSALLSTNIKERSLVAMQHPIPAIKAMVHIKAG